MGHVRFWIWTSGVWVCDRMPFRNWVPWCSVWHGGIVFHPQIADDDPCWARAGWR